MKQFVLFMLFALACFCYCVTVEQRINGLTVAILETKNKGYEWGQQREKEIRLITQDVDTLEEVIYNGDFPR